jgi:NNP family nitrate/nitrite transporter-like MFS transporter
MATTAAPIPRQAWSVLVVSTLAFTVCFMVWMMFGVIGIPLKKTLGLNATEFGLLTATPVLTGSLIRVPLGIWTDRYGGRIVMTLLMAATVPAIWLMSYATAYWHFLVLGLFVGVAGGSFSVGTPYVARWFPKAARAWRWACTAPATPARRSTSSPRRCCWPSAAGRWCRRSMPR